MNTIFKCLSLLLFIAIISSCSALVEENLPEIKKTPVLQALLIAGTPVKVHVSLTASLGDSIPKVEPNAMVTIQTDKEYCHLTYSGQGWYESNLTAIAGKTYSCTVDVPGYQQLFAETTVPEPTEVYDVKYTETAGFGMSNEKISSFEFTISNIPGKTLYWDVRYVQTDRSSVTSVNTDNNLSAGFSGYYYSYIFFKPEEDSIFMAEAEPLNIFSNTMMQTDSHRLKFYTSAGYHPRGNYCIELRSIDIEYYKYQKQFFIYSTSGYLGFGSSSQCYPLYSNVKNGYGVFTSCSMFYKNLNDLSSEN